MAVHGCQHSQQVLATLDQSQETWVSLGNAGADLWHALAVHTNVAAIGSLQWVVCSSDYVTDDDC